MDFSIYKLQTTKNAFIEMLTDDYEMEKLGESKKQIETRSLGENIFETELEVSFFFNKKPSDKEIKWYDYWSDYFNIQEEKRKSIESAFGVIVIEIDNKIYAISLGRGHHYANRVASEDFGFDVAEKIIKENAISLKSVKFYKQTKSRALTQYNNTFASNEVGESNEVVIGKIDTDEAFSDWLLKDYSENAVFGTAVKVNATEYNPSEILGLVYELYLIHDSDSFKRKVSFPRLKVIKENEDTQPKIQFLNKKLLDSLLKMDEDDISLSYFTEMDGDIFVHPINSEVRVKYRKEYRDVSYNINSIGEAISDLNCENIDEVKLISESTGERPKQIKKLLDFNTQYTDGRSYCLFKGKWAEFNHSYMEFIDREITKVNEITEYELKYNLESDHISKGEEIIREEPEKYGISKSYREYSYNVYLADKYDMKLYDRINVHDIFKDVEFADLYNENKNELIHVKIGSTKDWRYCIKQSSQVAPLLNIHSEKLIEDGVPEIKVLTLLLIVDTENIFEEDIVNFGNNKSLYFKTEIIEWVNKVREYNFVPRVIIAKDIR